MADKNTAMQIMACNQDTLRCKPSIFLMQIKEVHQLKAQPILGATEMQRNRMTEARLIKWLMVATAIIGFGSYALAQDDIGKIQYQASCASCHGADAKGDGPVSKELKTHPADLTVLAKDNNGVFPYDRVYQMIDGRNSTIASHGTREMPIWGYRFGPVHAHAFKARVLAVIDYLKTMQEK